SSNRRFLVNASTGSPFFYMADTAWHLFNKLSRSQADQYLSTRAKQGFTVIQAEVNTRFGANVNGDTPFVDGDPMQPNEDFFQNVDYIVGRATALGMYISLVPLDTRWASRGVFDPTSAYTFGRYLGARYRSSKIIWTLGGDIGGDEVPSGLTLWRELAAGIARGAANKDLSKVLMQYHPGYNQDSSQWFNGDAWLDMNAFQSGHGQNPANYNKVAADYAKSPTRPVMDIETDYEDIPAGIQAGAPRLTDYDVRKAQYWALFAGAHGVTYGNNNVWQFVKTISTRNLATMTWQEALDSPGANSMSVLKRLMLSRPYLNRVPDQGLIVGSTLSGGDHIQATRASDGSYAFVYTAGGKPVTVNLSKLSGSKLDVRWYNPRSGRSTYVGQFDKTGNRTFNAPVAGYDWVLVIDDASRHFGKP
ncbi:MAG TPA: glycoside hydrolase family 140 protein, partial [Tepidisphaeraceae bacterium]